VLLTRHHFEEAAQVIRQRITLQPRIGLILGSGLGPLADSVESPTTIPYTDIPHWHKGTVIGHAGRLVIGHLEGQAVLVMQGRVHFYEGVTMAEVTFPVRVMHALGIETLMVTNAAGSINPTYQTGDLMLLRDHIGLPGMAGLGPLMGPNDESLGPRFTPLTKVYDKRLRDLALQVAQQEQIPLHQGVYFSLAGPAFETPAEVRMIRILGGDAVGMSTAPEVMVAKHMGMRVLGISSITNECIDDEDSTLTINHEEVLEVGKMIVPRLSKLLRGVLRGMN
jgi:purine-nucleoside phosphorylase